MLGDLSKEQIEDLLHKEIIGRIGCYADNKVYVVPITFVYDGQYIIGHSAIGLKIEMMRKNPNVCFEVDHMENMANWQSVIATGLFEELKGETAMQAMEALMKRLQPLMTSTTSIPSHGLQASHAQDRKGLQAIVYRIKLIEKSGRFEKR